MVRNRIPITFALLIGIFVTLGCSHKNILNHPNENKKIILHINGWERVAFADHTDFFVKIMEN